MSAALADMVAGALARGRHPVESADRESVAPADLSVLAARAASALVDSAVRPGEPVHVRIGNRPADIASLLGVWQAGAVAVPVHVAAAASTVAGLQQATGARFLLDGDRLAVCGNSAPEERPLLREAALIIFTSGSTGQPKGVVIGHQRLADKVAVLARLLAFRSDDTVLVPLQLTFIFGLWVSLLALDAGARLLLVPRFSIEALTRGLERGATVLAGVPSMYRTLLAEGVAALGLRMVLTGGEVLPAPLADALRAAAPQAALYDLYGSTETGSCDFCLGPGDQPQGFGTIGVPTERVAFRLVPETAGDEAGELCIRTPFGMLGYLDNPALTASSFVDGFFRTGDLARPAGDGRVQLIGRSKDIIVRGGHKIAPLELDNLLCRHPGVAAALCAGVPHEQMGEAIHAVVVLRAGAGMSAADLREWLRARTEHFKVPDIFHFADALPAGPTGKADRRQVARIATRKDA